MSTSTVTKSKNKIVEMLNRLFYVERDVNIILFNDDNVYEGLVRQALMNVFGYSQPKAYDLMLTAHTYGSSIVWTGEKKEAEKYVLKLRTEYGLRTEVVDV
jgi:ATP-dependent Clp protease adapter protein ClpS